MQDASHRQRGIASAGLLNTSAYLFGHDRKSVDGGASFLHEGEQFVEELLPLRVVINFVQLKGIQNHNI